MQNNFIKEPIVVMVTNKTSKETKYAFADPEQGNLLDICGFFDDSIILVREDIQSLIDDLDDKKEEYIMHMTKQGINVFDINHEFYTNLCFHYNSPNNKDIPMNDRIPTFFVNITPCDTGCINKGVDFELEKFKCECKFKSFADNNALNSNLYGQSIAEMINIISSLNIEVLKCIKDIFNKKYFVKCIGGHIIIFNIEFFLFRFIAFKIYITFFLFFPLIFFIFGIVYYTFIFIFYICFYFFISSFFFLWRKRRFIYFNYSRFFIFYFFIIFKRFY